MTSESADKAWSAWSLGKLLRRKWRNVSMVFCYHQLHEEFRNNVSSCQMRKRVVSWFAMYTWVISRFATYTPIHGKCHGDAAWLETSNQRGEKTDKWQNMFPFLDTLGWYAQLFLNRYGMGFVGNHWVLMLPAFLQRHPDAITNWDVTCCPRPSFGIESMHTLLNRSPFHHIPSPAVVV